MSNEVSQGFRLSPQQRQAWAALRAGAGAEARCAVRVEGALRAGELEAALRELIGRHEILRTGFRSLPGMKFPVQVIGAGEVAWESIDLRDVDADEQRRLRAQLFAGTRGDGARGVVGGEPAGARNGDNSRGAGVRASLLALADERHVLFLALPALAADARSLENLTAELARLYAARLGAGEAADEPVQYVQFSEWQNELLEESADAEANEGREFWRRQSEAGHAAPRLPFERPGGGAGFEPERVSFELDARVLGGAEAAARAEGATVEAALLAGWHALLWQLLRHEAVAVGRKFDGRKFEELRDAVGLYDAELPVTAQLEDGLAFGRLVRQVGDAVRAGEQWQEYYPWPSGDAGGFFAYGFEYAEAPAPHAAAGLVFRLEEQRVCASRFKLKLRCVRRAEGLAAELHYDAALYARADIERLARQYARLLGDAAGRPGTPVGRLSVIDEDERRRVLLEFNDTREDFAGDACFHRLFEAQAARTPDAVAVVCEGERLTYAELNARANRLARHLRGLGVGPESRVALLAERSLPTVVAVLAVLKAGGAYVPLDAALPPERRASMLADSGARVLLTGRPDAPGEVSLNDLADEVSNDPTKEASNDPTKEAASNDATDETRRGAAAGGVAVVCFDADAAAAIAAEDASNLDGGATADNLAYVIYTSGSTGRPKGVAVGHRQLSNYVNSIARRLDLPAPAAYAVVSTFAADLGHTMTFPALALGGSLHVITQERSADAPALADYFTRHRIDCLKIVPSHLAALLAADESGRILPRRRLVLGGEASTPELAARVRRLAPDCRVFNHYGPTETTVGVLTHEVTTRAGEVGTRSSEVGTQTSNAGTQTSNAGTQPGEAVDKASEASAKAGEVDTQTNGDSARAGAVEAAGDGIESEDAVVRGTLPLGRAIANTRVYVLDADLEPVPFGAPGELHVAGACVARGYLNHAAATAERFVPDPFSTEPGARLYRTGDVARFLPDGTLEFLGRRDHQVKIRGYRVELGEVEAAVRRHAAVRECVVVARGAAVREAAAGRGGGAADTDAGQSVDAGGERRLVAYVVARRGQRPGVAELRAAVHEWLPEYMTPSAFVLIDKLPLTANGKLDLRALPSPEESQARSGGEHVAPRTDLEEVLAGIWSEVLGVERVGVRDNFFELGGHSLLAMRITSRLREIFRVELPLRALFEATTVEDLARAMAASEAKPGQFESIAKVLKKIKGMSAEGVRETLQARKL